MATDDKSSDIPTTKPFTPIVPSKAALVMIDFQRDFCDAGGYADTAFADSSLEWVESIIPDAMRLLQGARQSNFRLIIHTREGYAPDLSDGHTVHNKKNPDSGAGTPGPLGRFLIRGEYGHDTTDRLKPIEGEVVLDKCTYGTFASTDIQQRLQDAGVTQVVLAGVTADVCVHTTLREAVDRGFECFYVKDAISTPDAFIRKACEVMVEYEGGIWGWLVTVDDVLKSVRTNGTTGNETKKE